MTDTEKNPYEILGEDGIRALVSAFYDIMDENPAFGKLRRMHAPDLTPMKDKLSEYLIGWMGGPPIYLNKYGTVCMTEPHEHYHIGPQERDMWLACMDQALVRIEACEEVVEMLKIPMFRIADQVRNREGASIAESDPNIIAAG
jgi:hemoglobin